MTRSLYCKRKFIVRVSHIKKTWSNNAPRPTIEPSYAKLLLKQHWGMSLARQGWKACKRLHARPTTLSFSDSIFRPNFPKEPGNGYAAVFCSSVIKMPIVVDRDGGKIRNLVTKAQRQETLKKMAQKWFFKNFLNH